MRLRINGQLMEASALTVAELLRELGIEPRAVAVEVNLSIVPKKDYQVFRLKEGDTVEIVSFVGGG